jgi:hypothetical protein
MAKTKTPLTASTKSKQASELKDSDLNFGKWDNYIYIGVIILALFVFFREGIFGGKVFASGDHIAFDSFKTFFEDTKKEGIFALWTPYIFMGMPNFAGLIGFSPRVYDLFGHGFGMILSLFGNPESNPIFSIVIYYIIFAIGFYLYINYKFKNKLVALFTALMAVFATDLVQRMVTGHNTKVFAIMFFPLILLVIERLIDYDYKNIFSKIVDVALLTIMFHIQLTSNHMQMIFYSYLFIGIYVLYIFVARLIKKESYRSALMAGVFVILGAGLSVAMNADVIMSVKEYNKYSMRGVPSIQTQTAPSGKNAEPLDYDYATRWSFSPGEVLTFYAPYYFGFGDVEYQGQRANLYWGQMPFTTAPVYFGVIVLTLALIGIFYNFRRNVYVQALTLIVFAFLLLSFGRNGGVLFDIFFYYVPFFSSFRAPVMIHNFMDVGFAILAGYGLMSMVGSIRNQIETEKFKKVSFVVMGIAGLIFIISIVGFKSSYRDSVLNGPKAQEYKKMGASPQQISQQLGQMADIAYDNITSDLQLHSFLILLVMGAALLYSKRMINYKLFMFLVILIGMFDLWNVNNKTVHWDNKSASENAFTETDYTNFILKANPDTYQYRIVELRQGEPTTTNNYAFYRLQAFNGYQGAKMRIYQDALDVVGGGNPLLLGLANVKYVLTDPKDPGTDTSFIPVMKGSKTVAENKMFLPRAFFVNEYKVEQPINILNNIKYMNFNPRQTAFVEKDINKKIDKPDSTASIKMVKATTESYEYDVTATGNNLMFMSDIYYPAGWKAYIDGVETEIYKTDYLFRSIVVPSGKHKVEIKFQPETYYKGKTITLVSNILVGLVLIVGLAGVFKNKKETESKEIKS